jgi:hypothetical protein
MGRHIAVRLGISLAGNIRLAVSRPWDYDKLRHQFFVQLL